MYSYLRRTEYAKSNTYRQYLQPIHFLYTLGKSFFGGKNVNKFERFLRYLLHIIRSMILMT